MFDWKKTETEFKTRLKEAMEASRALPDGWHLHKILEIPVADGYAYYEIVNLSKNTVTLKWRKDLSPDHYSDLMLRQGGKFMKRQIKHIVDMQDVEKRLPWNKA